MLCIILLFAGYMAMAFEIVGYTNVLKDSCERKYRLKFFFYFIGFKIKFQCILVYLTLVSLLCFSRSRYITTYGPLIRGVFSHEVFDDEDDRMATSLLLIQGIMVLSAIIIVVQLNYVFKRLSSIWEKRNRSA